MRSFTAARGGILSPCGALLCLAALSNEGQILPAAAPDNPSTGCFSPLCWAVWPLPSALDAGPGARAQPLIVRVEFRRQEQPRSYLRGRINARVFEDHGIDIAPRRQVVIAVEGIVGDVGDHLGVENEVQEAMRRVRMRCVGGNEHGVVGDVGAL